MGKILLEYQSRRIYPGPKEESVSELFDAVGHCNFVDDAQSDNDFDFTMTSDAERFSSAIAYDEAETVISAQAGTAIAGTRTSGSLFECAVGTTLVVDGLIGYTAGFYADTAPDTITWLTIIDNDATHVTVSGGSIPAGSTRIIVANRAAFRHNIQLVMQAGFYGTFFQYRIDKKIPLDGNFKWSGMDLRALPRPGIDPEFLAGSGSISNGWTT